VDGGINVRACDREDLNLRDDENIDDGDKLSDRTRNRSVAPNGD
jgi:hypothetical protein